MWNYKNQIKLRWISFILGLIILIGILLYANHTQALSQTGMKVFLTKHQVSFESTPIWGYILIILANISALLIGVPSVCIVLPLMLLHSCTFAFVVCSACQITASLLAMWISYNFGSSSVSPNLINKLEANKDEFQSFAFWSRIYYNIPLRTIDKLTPYVHNNKETYFSTLIAASCAILIRILIPSMALKHVIDQFTLLEPNPVLENDKLIIWSIILIAYTVLPKMPEIMICPNNVKKVIFEIEKPTPLKKKSIEPEIQETDDKKTLEMDNGNNPNSVSNNNNSI